MIDWLLRWLKSGTDPRGAPREAGEGLTAFYWEGASPCGHRIRDISKRGAYVETDSISWSSGTQMIVTLQLESDKRPAGTPPETLALQAEVVRASTKGMALSFVLPGISDRRSLIQFLSKWKKGNKASRDGASDACAEKAVCSPSTQPGLELPHSGAQPDPVSGPFVGPPHAARRLGQEGSASIGFALMVPLILLLIVSSVTFGNSMYARSTVEDEVRTGFQYGVIGGAAVFTAFGFDSAAQGLVDSNPAEAEARE